MGDGIALFLSGGSIRGAAHIGVIRRLEELGLDKEVAFVAGTSAGSLVAALFAQGRGSGEIWDIWSNFATRRNMLDPDVMGLIKGLFTRSKVQGLFKGGRIVKVLKRYMGDSRIEDMPRKLAIVATDINSGEGRLFTRGPVVPVLRASISIPGVYTPVELDGRMYVDGGVTDYVPLRALECFCGCDRTLAYAPLKCDPGSLFRRLIAVNLGYAGSRPRCTGGLADIVSQSIEIQGGSLSRMILEKFPSALVINPKVYDVGGFDTGKSEYCMHKGYEAARRILG